MIDPIETSLTEKELFQWTPETKVDYEPDDESITDSISLPRGKYFVGDPCHALTEDAYQILLATDHGEECDIEGVGRCVYFANEFEGGSNDLPTYTFDSSQLGITCIDNLDPGYWARLKELGDIFELAWGDPLPEDPEEDWENAGAVLIDAQGSVLLGRDWFWHYSSTQAAHWRRLNGLID